MIRNLTSLGDVAAAFTNPEPRLLGLGFVTGDHEWTTDEPAEVSFEVTGMFSLNEGSAHFRLRIEAKVVVLPVLWIDLAVGYSAPDRYSVTKSAFLEYANRVAASVLRVKAQAILDPLLVAAGLPPHILPASLETDAEPFKGTQLPDILSPEAMTELREKPDLAIADYPSTEN